MSKVKYQSYKPSKTIWLDQIPEHWQETDLRMLFADNRRKNVGLIEKNLLSLSYGKLKRKDIDNATGLVPESFEGYQIIEEGYIILRFTDLQNDKKSLRVGYVNEKGIITSAYIGLSPKTDLDSKYYYYLLHYLDKFKYYYNLGGGVRQSLSYKDFGRETIIVPSKKEQITIAKFLDYKTEKINRFITKKKQLIKLLNEQKAAIINQAVTKGINPNVPMKDSGIEWLGEIPEHWEVRKLKYVANCFPSNVDKHSKEEEKEVRLCNYTDVYKNDFITNDMKLMIATAKDDQIKKFALKKDDVIITKDSETADDIANPALVIEDLENVICGYHLSIMRPYSKLKGEYLLRALQCKPINVQFELCSNGVTRVGLGVADMKKAEIPLPPLEEQENITNFIQRELNTLNKTISTIEKEITLVEEYKTALIAEAVTGKIDVRDFKLPTEETPLAMVAEEASNYKKEVN
ncbi:restriction endonuclease subunit S [uncultured Maribacter sp.]|uniref:restriction endonuclease subunit S n=1 Tax=uncultured Maribacter sp. TaxID=431308 RepID=UPI002638840D|nr:restriction endonuclease subunit S [uncultured Maribacter sp.]